MYCFRKKNQAIYKNLPDAVSFLETLTPSERYFPDPGDARREGLRRLLARAAEVGAGAMANLYDGPDEEEEEMVKNLNFFSRCSLGL